MARELTSVASDWLKLAVIVIVALFIGTVIINALAKKFGTAPVVGGPVRLLQWTDQVATNQRAA